MCNCTAGPTDPTTAPRTAQARSPTPPRGPRVPLAQPFTGTAWHGGGAGRTQEGMNPKTPAQHRAGTKKIALDPAESSAIDGQALLGQRPGRVVRSRRIDGVGAPETPLYGAVVPAQRV